MTKTILITGSTDGIGNTLLKKLASEGHEVIIHGRNPKKLEKAYEEVNSYSKEKFSSCIQKRIYKTWMTSYL